MVPLDGEEAEKETHHFLSCHPCPSVLLEHLHHTFGLEIPSDRFIRPREYDSVQAVEFFELNWRWWVDGHHADDGRFDLGWWTEVVPGDIDDIVHFCVKLQVIDRRINSGLP